MLGLLKCMLFQYFHDTVLQLVLCNLLLEINMDPTGHGSHWTLVPRGFHLRVIHPRGFYISGIRPRGIQPRFIDPTDALCDQC